MMTTRSGSQTAHAITQATIRLIWQHGYQATTLRELADEVGIKVGSLYNHIDSKEALLYSIMTTVMDDVTDAMNDALRHQNGSVPRLLAAVECHVTFHAERAQEVFIGNSEIRSLSAARRDAFIRQRSDYEDILRGVLHEGVTEGEFVVGDEQLVVNAIVAIGINVAVWYRPEGRMPLPQIASFYSDLILRAVQTGRALPPRVGKHQSWMP